MDESSETLNKLNSSPNLQAHDYTDNIVDRKEQKETGIQMEMEIEMSAEDKGHEKGIKQKINGDDVNYILGIEGSANKLGISIINGKNEILVNSRRTFVSEIGCGFIPREVSVHHKHFIIEMIEECLKKVQIKITDINLLCYTKGPGIGSALYIGYNVCKILSSLFHIPVVGVNHCIAHIEMGIFITKLLHPIILYVSGSNTQIIYFNCHKKKYEIVGETLDIAIGNVIDRSARIMKISNTPSPGYNVEQLAKKKKLLNILKRRKMREKAKKNNMDNNFLHCADKNTTSITENCATKSNEKKGKQQKGNQHKSTYADTTDYTELLFFPYTIKGMDISFSGYDFYINKYFAKFIQKNKQVEKSNLKKKQKEKNKLTKVQAGHILEKGLTKKVKTGLECEQSQQGEINKTKDNEIQQNQKKKLQTIENAQEEKEEDEAKKNNIVYTTDNERINDVPGVQGKSYFEENIIYQNEHKQNYGDQDIYVEDDYSIETDTDFYERESSTDHTDTGDEKKEKEKKSLEEELKSLSDEEKRKIQICYSLQHHIFSMLIEITERAISFTNSKEVIIVGGVGCNVFLQSMMKKMAKQKNIKIGFMDHSYCVDNGAMIAYTGYLEYIHAKDKTKYNFENISIHQRFRTDDVFVTWS